MLKILTYLLAACILVSSVSAGYILKDTFEAATADGFASFWTEAGAGLTKNTTYVYEGSQSSCVNLGGSGAPRITTTTNITADSSCEVMVYLQSTGGTGTGFGLNQGTDESYGIMYYWANANWSQGKYTAQVQNYYPKTNAAWHRVGFHVIDTQNLEYFANGVHTASTLATSTGAGYEIWIGGEGGAWDTGVVCVDDFSCWSGNYSAKPSGANAFSFVQQTPANNTYTYNAAPEFAMSYTSNNIGTVWLVMNGTRVGTNYTPSSSYASVFPSERTNFTEYEWYFGYNFTNGSFGNTSAYNRWIYVAGRTTPTGGGSSSPLNCLLVTAGCSASWDNACYVVK